MSAAEELAGAADKLDALAAQATDGPWKYTAKNYIETGPIEINEADWGPEGHEGLRISTQQDHNAFRYADIAYIAAMNPLVGKALAAWLREASRNAAAQRGWDAEAVTLARLINGAES